MVKRLLLMALFASMFLIPIGFSASTFCVKLNSGNVCFNTTITTGTKLNWSDILNPPAGGTGTVTQINLGEGIANNGTPITTTGTIGVNLTYLNQALNVSSSGSSNVTAGEGIIVSGSKVSINSTYVTTRNSISTINNSQLDCGNIINSASPLCSLWPNSAGIVNLPPLNVSGDFSAWANKFNVAALNVTGTFSNSSLTSLDANKLLNIAFLNFAILLRPANITGDFSVWNGLLNVDWANITSKPTIPAATTTLPMTNITQTSGMNGTNWSFVNAWQLASQFSDFFINKTTTWAYNFTNGTGYQWSNIVGSPAIISGVTIPMTNVTGFNGVPALPMANVTGYNGVPSLPMSNITGYNGVPTLPMSNVTGFNGVPALPATNITTGTFGKGNYTFPDNLTVDSGTLTVNARDNVVSINTTNTLSSNSASLVVSGGINQTNGNVWLPQSTMSYNSTCDFIIYNSTMSAVFSICRS